jgi:hypothetical protein
MIAFLSLSASTLVAQSTAPVITVQAVRISEPITIDGILSESAWNRPGFSKFTQRDPNEGKEPTEKTEVWVGYDDAAIYIAAKMYDSAPDSIMAKLGRRDDYMTADWFSAYVDSYHDRKSGYMFSLNSAGSMQDATLYNDSWDDWSWDGVWEGRATINSEGWSIEMRIPYSQLRFQEQEQYVWGINFKRFIGRKNEGDYVVFQPKKESGFVSRFPDLVGIERVTPPPRVEVLPYINTRAEYKQHASGDPFNTGSRLFPGMGADVKIGLGSNLTLDATVNPDFGQVEVDPAVVNLSDVESYFQEKRPFFIEGANTFNFGYGGATNYWGFNWGGPSLLYTRRIGRTPQGSVPSADFADLPIGTHILGAAKLTGKVLDRWNVGLVNAVTAREFADLQTSGTRSEAEIEPSTYYGIARAQKDFNDGKQGIGFMSTYAQRFFKDERLRDEINSDAFVFGLDGWTFLDSSKTYVITGWTVLSRVGGNTARMLSLQQSSAHYFQRPDAPYVRVDSSATSLTGYAGRFTINKEKGPMNFNAAIGFLSPKFNSNDLGFMWRNDVINGHVATGYRWTDPTDYYRRLSFNVSYFSTYDYGGDKTWQGYWSNMNWDFLNYDGVWMNYAYNPSTISNRMTRGGPRVVSPQGWQLGGGGYSDSRKPIVVNAYGSTYQGGGGNNWYSEIDVEWKPAPNMSLTVGPSFSKNHTEAQWVGVFDDPTATATYGHRYVFAYFNGTEVAANIRLNWIFTPKLSLQLFAQPLISSGEYVDYKELAKPNSYQFLRYGDNGSTIVPQKDAGGNVTGFVSDPDGPGPAAPFSFDNPNFNYKSLRGNAVLRWEYRPGSTLYIVWTQSRSDYENNGDFQFNQSMQRLWGAKPDNIFMLKFSYWWSM